MPLSPNIEMKDTLSGRVLKDINGNVSPNM